MAPTFKLEAVDKVKNEGDDGRTEFRFTIRREGDFDPTAHYHVLLQLDTPIQLDVFDDPHFSPQLAETNSDGRLSIRAGVVVFAGDETEETLIVSVAGDHLLEPDEILKVKLIGYDVFEENVRTGRETIDADATVTAAAVAVIRNDDDAAEHAIDDRHVEIAQRFGLGLGAVTELSQTPNANDVQDANEENAKSALDEALRDGTLTNDEEQAIRDAFGDDGFAEDLDDWIDKAKQKLEEAGDVDVEGTSFHFVAYDPDATSVRTGTGKFDVAFVDTPSEYVLERTLEGGIQIYTLMNGQTLLFEDIERVQFNDLPFAREPVAWYDSVTDVEISAAAYQFFTQRVPTADGFAHLISSPDNPNDLTDRYYDAFNTENRYINFANNLGSFGEGSAAFEDKYGGMSFEETVNTAFEEIIGSQAVLENGGNPQESIQFFLDAYDFYADVANERVVPGGVAFDQAVKVVAIGSILNEALKADVGVYANALKDFTSDVFADGHSSYYGQDLFTFA